MAKLVFLVISDYLFVKLSRSDEILTLICSYCYPLKNQLYLDEAQQERNLSYIIVYLLSRFLHSIDWSINDDFIIAKA